MDTLQRIMDWESGELSWDSELELFQYLVDSGLAWTLQGTYGRHARALINAGFIAAPVK